MAHPYTARKAAVIIDNSGSTSQKTGIIHEESGHPMIELDRHILTAATYLANFPKKGIYRIISCFTSEQEFGEWRPFAGATESVRDFDNTDDAIEYLFTLRPGGGGFINGYDTELEELTKDYHHVLLIVDQDVSYSASNMTKKVYDSRKAARQKARENPIPKRYPIVGCMDPESPEYDPDAEEEEPGDCDYFTDDQHRRMKEATDMMKDGGWHDERMDEIVELLKDMEPVKWNPSNGNDS